MNPLQAYERTIKGKLEAIPLPDMEDAIWARIEAQLDTDMPTDDGNDHGPAGGIPPRTWIGGGALLIFLVSLFTIFYNRDNEELNSTSQPLNPPEPTETIQSNDQSPGISNENILNPLAPSSRGVVGVDSAQDLLQPGVVPSPVIPALQDSAANNIILPDNSGVINSPVINPPANSPPAAKDSIPQKKPRGVKNITDNDYKIVPKKDNE